jgi:acyl-CoA synthetase (AMP-forming)/AMP-acid ligase II
MAAPVTAPTLAAPSVNNQCTKRGTPVSISLPSDLDQRPVLVIGAGTLGARIALMFAAGERDISALEIDADGWFKTGDMAKVDDDGYFFIVDRKKELVIRGGFDIYPREIEEVLPPDAPTER